MGFISSLGRDLKGGTSAYKDLNAQRNKWVTEHLKSKGITRNENPTGPVDSEGGGSSGMGVDIDYIEAERKAQAAWLDTLDPTTKAKALNEFRQHSDDMGVINKYGSMATKALLGTIAGGAALTAGGVIGAGASNAGAGAVGLDFGAGAASGSGTAGGASAAAGGLSAAEAAGALGGAAGTSGGGLTAAQAAGAVSTGGAAASGVGTAVSAAAKALGGGGLWSSLLPAATTGLGLVNSYITGKNTEDAINASAPARAGSMNVGDKQMALADQNFQEQMALFEQFKPMLTDMVNSSVEASKVSTQRSNDLWADYVQTWKPVGEELARKSLDYASEGRMASEAARAASETKSQYDDAMTESRRSLEMAGASQDKIAALEADARLKAAKAIGGASSSARREVESKGMAYLDNAARLGLSVPGLSTQQAGLSLSQTQQAQSGIGATTAAAAVPVATTSSILSAANSAYGTASGQGLAAARGSLDNAINTNAGYGDALAAGAKLVGLFNGA